MAQITSDFDGFVKLFCDEGGEKVEHILIKAGCKIKIFHTAEEVGKWIEKELLEYTSGKALLEQPLETQARQGMGEGRPSGPMEIDNEA